MALVCAALRKQLLSAYKQIWCWQDEWLGLDMAAVRRMEEETGVYLKRLMHQPQSRAGKPSLEHSVSAPSFADLASFKPRLQNANGAQSPQSPSASAAASSSAVNEQQPTGERAKLVLELTQEDGAEEALEA